MSPAMVAALSWPTIVLIILIAQTLVIWRLRARVRELSEYEYLYFNQQYQQPQPVQPARSLRRPLPRPR